MPFVQPETIRSLARPLHAALTLQFRYVTEHCNPVQEVDVDDDGMFQDKDLLSELSVYSQTKPYSIR